MARVARAASPRENDLAPGQAPAGFTYLPGSPASQESYLCALLRRSLNGSAQDRIRAHSAFCRVLHDDTVLIATKYYPVSGSTGGEVLESMRRACPDSGEAGSTEWSFHWQAVPFEAAYSRPSCGAAISARITITLPTWKPAHADPDEVAAWGQFSHALLYHEQGHQLIAEFTLAVLRLRIDQNSSLTNPLPIDDVCDEVAEEYGNLDRQYDRATWHGALQGAVFSYE